MAATYLALRFLIVAKVSVVLSWGRRSDDMLGLIQTTA